MNRVALLAVVCAFCMAASVFAQQAQTLTLESSVDIALQNNVSVLQARNTLDAQQSITQAAVGNLLPSLQLSGGFSRNQLWSEQQGGVVFVQGVPIPVGGGSTFRANNSFSSTISSQVTLFNGFSNTANVNRARANANASEYSLTRTEQNTVFQTHQLFLNIVRTYQLLKVSEDNLKRSQRQLERITESNKVGAVALADVYRQRVQVGSDELALIQAQSNHEKAKADIVAFLGIQSDAEYRFDFSNVPQDIDTTEFSALNAQYANFNSLVQTALDRRPDHRAGIENVNGAQSSVTMARSAYYPSVSASGSYGYSNTELSRLTDNRNLFFGVNLSLPIFNGFTRESQVQQAVVQRKNAEEALQQSRRQIAVDIRKALLDLEAAEKQVTVTQTSVESAEMDRRIAEEKYNLGAGTLLDLLVANANYTTALSNKVNAVTNFLLSKKQVEYALGTIVK